MNLPDDVYYILNTLHEKGYFSVVVGGAVRDFYRGEEVQDYDIATEARPEEISEVFSNYKVIPVGLVYGTVMLRLNDNSYEITTFRRESAYEDYRHPQVIDFISDLKIDLSRRDFTINAMAYSLDENKQGVLYDYYHGLVDLKNKVIRTVGKAEERFNEDALRILRALRFSSRFSFKIEEQTKEAILNNYHLLANVAKERIMVELRKLFEDNLSWVLSEYAIVFSYLCNGLSEEAIGRYLKCVLQTPPEFELRLALLLLDQTEFSLTLPQFKLSKQKRNTIINIIKYYPLVNDISINAMLIYFDKIPLEALRGIVYLKVATGDLENAVQVYNDLYNRPHKIKDLAINGYDLQNLGLAPSKKIKEYLFFLLTKVANDEVKNNKNDLIAYIKKIYNLG